jgi:hypothetical protein
MNPRSRGNIARDRAKTRNLGRDRALARTGKIRGGTPRIETREPAARPKGTRGGFVFGPQAGGLTPGASTRGPQVGGLKPGASSRGLRSGASSRGLRSGAWSGFERVHRWGLRVRDPVFGHDSTRSSRRQGFGAIEGLRAIESPIGFGAVRDEAHARMDRARCAAPPGCALSRCDRPCAAEPARDRRRLGCAAAGRIAGGRRPTGGRRDGYPRGSASALRRRGRSISSKAARRTKR